MRHCSAVSAVNGCGMCMDAHEEELRKAGFTQETYGTFEVSFLEASPAINAR